MNFLVKRFRRLRLVFKITLPLLFILLIFSVARNRIFPYFDKRCYDYRQKDFSRRLNDRIVDYAPEAKRKGIAVCVDNDDLKERLGAGKLVKVRSCSMYKVDKLTYSSPYLTRDSRELLDEIGRRLREKASAKGLNGVKFVVTSMTRKTENVRNLRKRNVNSSENSPHLYGNAFDISYKRISARKWVLTNCDQKYLKDALGEVIWQLRTENKCFATYERMQNCFHIVAR